MSAGTGTTPCPHCGASLKPSDHMRGRHNCLAVFPRVVRVENNEGPLEGQHYAVWVRMSVESNDVIHVDFDGRVTNEEAIACAEYLRLASGHTPAPEHIHSTEDR